MYLKLINKEKTALLALKQKRNSNLRIRAECVLLASKGMIADKISKKTGYCAPSVRNWVNRYKAEGIEGLYERKHTGRKPTKANIIKKEINELLSKSAEDYGYPDANWTISLLIDYFSKKGCDASKDTFRRVLKAEGWCYKRLSKVPPKKGPTKEEKTARIKEIIAAIKEAQEEEPVTILTGDECHFSIQPYVQRGWCRIGEKTKVGTSKKKKVAQSLEH